MTFDFHDWYDDELPSGLSPEEENSWRDAHRTNEAHELVAIHELSHYVALRKSDFNPNDITVSLGHSVEKNASAYVHVDPALWRKRFSENDIAAEYAYLSYLLMPGIVGERLAVNETLLAHNVSSDREDAARFLHDSGYNHVQSLALMGRAFDGLRRDTTSEDVSAIQYAAKQLTLYHKNATLAGSLVEHYIDRKPYEELPKES